MICSFSKPNKETQKEYSVLAVRIERGKYNSWFEKAIHNFERVSDKFVNFLSIISLHNIYIMVSAVFKHTV